MVLVLFLYKDSFGIKQPTVVDMSLNKETSPNYLSLPKSIK